MSTRAMILVEYGEAWTSPYHMYYRHYDGYPSGLGNDLLNAMEKGKFIEDILKEVGARDEAGTIANPEDAFLKHQGDLEWIYVIRNPDSDSISLEILKTSCPGLIGKDFVFSVFWSYRKYFSNAPDMKLVEYVGSVLKGSMIELLKTIEAGLKKAPVPSSSGEVVS